MERLTLITDADTGQNKRASGGKEKQSCKEIPKSSRSSSAKRHETDGGADPGKRGERGVRKGGRVKTGGGRGFEGVRGRGAEGAAAAAGRGGNGGEGGGGAAGRGGRGGAANRGGRGGAANRGRGEDAAGWGGGGGRGEAAGRGGRGGAANRGGRGGAANRGRGEDAAGWGRGGGGAAADRGRRREGSAGRGTFRRMAEMGGRRGGSWGEKRDGVGDRQDWREGRSNSTGRPGAPQGRGLGFNTLRELSGEDPSVVAITLSAHPALKEVLRVTEMRQDLIELLCLVLSKAFKSQADRSTLQHLAGIIKDSGFFRTILPHYLGGMGSEFNAVRRADYPRNLQNILTILSEVLSIFPASSAQAASMLLTLLKASINNLRASGVDFQPHMEESVENLEGLIKHLQDRSREGTLRSDKDTYALLPTVGDNPGEEMQQDFRTIPIYPTPEEFQQEQRPYLRPNLTSKRYTNTHLYLDTHFRLLREDFVRPLREGIQELLRSQMDKAGGGDNPLKKKQFDDIRVYFDTKLVVPKCTPAGIAYIVQFDIQPLKFVRWQSSKRLIYGSLVCLSCDNFETFLYATVSDRDPKTLEKGLVQIAFTEESRSKLARFENDQLFLMVETTAYFEAYRYVLEGLKEQEEDDLPFQRYIVECNPDVRPPAYLQIRDDYDLSSVAHPDHKHNIQPFHSLKAQAWPTKEDLGLDESQMRAFQLALTKELTIIQGPPGTGKTYVGLKIAQALLTNQELWRDGLGRAPMLVVCYTNHALDQFLEGIHTFLPDGIVRVGGRSNSEILKRFNLRELIHSSNFKRTLPPELHRAYNQLYRQLCEEERGIQTQSVKLECSLKGILRESFLLNAISHRHWDSLHQQLPTGDGFRIWGEKKSSLIMEWLGLGSTVFLQRETENANGHDAEDSLELDDRDDLISIAEEADLILEERFIEDCSGPRGGRDGKKNGNMEEAIRAVEEQMLAMNLDTDEVQAEQSEGGGWEIQRSQKKKLKKRIRTELGKTSAMTKTEEDAVLDIWTLNQRDRWRLYRLWVTRYRVELRTIIQESEEAYQNAVDRLADVKRHENLCLLKQATVIGMTTTGAAKFRSVLQKVRPRLVIVEEAAEVLEAHTITTLSKACQHLILIGDHQQLRPSATVYELAKNFNLEMSMFERLVKMELPYVRLDYQHRMRPEIARLLTPHIYAELENHPSVLDYDSIKGLDTNLFFVEHNNLEEGIKDGKSHQNKHEALFVVSLCRYLIFQGYKPEQITILTTYTGQLYCLRNLMPANQFTGVKVHVVDKYQGEENDIVLLSLVRSNLQGKVGFLNIPNRVCVALSRAKKGLYCIGNSAMLAQVKLWGNIFHTLREKDQIGSALTLCCLNHPERKVKAAHADDFKQAPEGGCTKPCEFRLDCGHVCTRVCHPYDPEHKEYQCIKKCEKILCDLGHRCKLVCHIKCPGRCSVMVEKIIPRCQHTQMVRCHQDPETFTCLEPCMELRLCGHPCESFCGEPCTSPCNVKVTLELECGHSQQEACFYKTHTQEPECRTTCEEQLKCGHACNGRCGQCFQGRFHSPCLYNCDRLLICSHMCREPCTRNCPPCERPCENCCVHSKCTKPCGLPCAPCIEPCTWQCPHQSCSKLCHEPCDRLPCNQPCAKTLDCGHRCIGLCGDKCPSKCRICNHDEVTEIFFGTEDEPEAFFIQLEDCGHIIEYTAMDQYMGMDANQQANDEEDVVIKLKECPKCKTPIRKNLRYGSHINRCLAEIEMVKVKINGCQANIEEHRKTLRKQWADNRPLFGMLCQKDYMQIKHRLEKCLLIKDLLILENQMDFLIKVAKLKKIQKEKLSAAQSLTLGEHVEEFVRWLNNPWQKFTEQQVFDLQRELQRISLLTELHARCHLADMRGQSDKIQSEVQTITGVLKKCGQFTEQAQDLVREAMKDLDKRLPPTGLGINEEEKKMIVSALQMQPGHWYKCPNGHVYIITECGGATVSRRCTDCDATIGGANHRLAGGNRVASEMDGAQHPAWSETNNLENFHLLNF